MLKILVPITGTRNDRFAVQDVMKPFMNNTAMEVHAVHIEIGDRAQAITDAARRLHCEEIVMATARKNFLTRWV